MIQRKLWHVANTQKLPAIHMITNYRILTKDNETGIIIINI